MFVAFGVPMDGMLREYTCLTMGDSDPAPPLGVMPAASDSESENSSLLWGV